MAGAGKNKGRGLGWGSSSKPHNTENEQGEYFLTFYQFYLTGSIPGAENRSYT